MGNLRAFRLASMLVRKFDLDPEERRAVVGAYNGRLDEPLDDAGLDAVRDKALRQVHERDRPRGTLLDAVQGARPGVMARTGSFTNRLRSGCSTAVP